MNANINIINERVDDIPLLIANMKKMGLVDLLNKWFTTHGHWGGLDLGHTTIGWLSHILSESNHRLYLVQKWASYRLKSLSALVEQEVRELDFTDDRLGDILKHFSKDQNWTNFESELNKQLIRVYDLSTDIVRLDATTVSSHGMINENGLLQLGHSKDFRPDLGQFKLMLSSLDPLGLPISSMVVSGENADDPLYLPVIQSSQRDLGKSGLLYVGDSKMASLEVRSHIQQSGDYYLTPLSRVQMPIEKIKKLIKNHLDQGLPFSIVEEINGDNKKEIAFGFETERKQIYNQDASQYEWQERMFILQSKQYAKSQSRALQERISKVKSEIESFNLRGKGHKPPKSLAEAENKVLSKIKQYKLEGLLTVDYHVETQEKHVRAYKDQPARTISNEIITVYVTINQEAVTEAEALLGWRVYVSNNPNKAFNLNQATLAYRGEYIIEHDFSRLKGRPLSLSPLFLERDDHIIGLTRLLLIALRVLLLFEFQIRQKIAEEDMPISGLYPGNPKRKTARPSALILLKAFEEINLTIVSQGDSILSIHVSELNPTQEEVLRLNGFTTAIYLKLSQFLISLKI